MFKLVAGILLIWIGVRILLERLNIIIDFPTLDWGLIWPIGLIILGWLQYEWRGKINTIIGLIITLGIVGLIVYGMLVSSS